VPSHSRIITAVEIGTSKTAALMGELSVDNQSLNIIGFGLSPTRGVSKGVITDITLAGESTHAAIESAEKNAGCMSAEGVFLALTGGHVRGYANSGIVEIQSKEGTVSQSDIESVTNQSRMRPPPDEHAVIHFIQGPYILDGKPVDQPLRMRGRRLESTCWITYARTTQLAHSISMINDYGLRVCDIILSSLGSAQSVTTREERRHGVLVVDIGAGTTDYVLYRNGFVVSTGVIPVGGQHVTNDLSLALQITPQQAEALKLRCGRAVMQCKDRNERVWRLGERSIGDKEVPLMSIERVCAVRMEELFTILKQNLEAHLIPEAINVGVVLTGGASRMPGVEQLASSVLGLPARLGEHLSMPVNGDLQGGQYSTVLGVLQYGMLETASRLRTKRTSSIFHSVMKTLKLA
jgi:cell division protein FtsA